MARTAITAQTPVGPHPSTIEAGDLDITMVDVDPDNENYFAASGSDLIIMFNTNGIALGASVTIKSEPDYMNRSADIADYEVDNGEPEFFYVGNTDGWADSSGNVNIDSTHTDVEIAVLRV